MSSINKYDERYIIRLAEKSDIESIMKFIDNYWRKDHILACDRELFEYEYVNGDAVNFVLAIDRNTQLIEGIFGFLNCSQTKDSTKKDIWGSLWKVVDIHDNIPFLGIELAKRVFKLTGCRTQIGNGANPNTTVPLRRMFFGDKVAKMKQYYIINTTIEDYKIAVINKKVEVHVDSSQSNTMLVELNTMEEVKSVFDVESIDAIPYKDNWYLNKRYFQHPYYKYSVYGLFKEEGKVEALMVTRVIECNGSKVLRIVDYIGEQCLIAGLGSAVINWFNEYNFEYVDFYTLGLKEDYILRAGFKLRTDDDPNIIPNYFEPFDRKNVDNWTHYHYTGTLFFKADGDQDRPNVFNK